MSQSRSYFTILFLSLAMFLGCNSGTNKAKRNIPDAPIGGSGGNGDGPDDPMGGNAGGGDGPDDPMGGNAGGGDGPDDPMGGNAGGGDGPDDPMGGNAGGGNAGGGDGPDDPMGGNAGGGDGPDDPMGGNAGGGDGPDDPIGGSGGDGRMEVDPPIANEDELAALNCGNINILTAEDLTANHDPDINLWTFEGVIQAGASETTGFCNGANPGTNAEVVLPFKAPFEGVYSVLTLEQNVNNQSPYATYTRAECANRDSEFACGYRNLNRGSQNGLIFNANENDVILLFIDLEQDLNTRFTLQIIGAADTAPMLEQENSFLHVQNGNTANVKATGSDPNADVVTIRMNFFDQDDMPIGEQVVEDATKVFGQTNFILRNGFNVEIGQTISYVNVQIEDSQGNTSAAVRLEAQQQPILAEGEPCDPAGFDNQCNNVERIQCVRNADGEARCQIPLTIDNDRNRAFRNENELHFVIEGEVIDRDFQVYSYEFLNEEALIQGLEGFNNGQIIRDILDMDGTHFTLSVQTDIDPNPEGAGQSPIPMDATHVRITLIAQHGNLITSDSIEIQDIPRPLEGEPCDLRFVENICDGALTCIDTNAGLEPPSPQCQPRDNFISCPDGFMVEALEVPDAANETIRVIGDTRDHQNVAIGSCGGDLGDEVFSFTADVDARYQFLVDTNVETIDDLGNNITIFWQPTLFIRKQCSVSDEISESGCTNINGVPIELDLAADETVYLFVSGSLPQDVGNSEEQQGPFELQVTRLP